MPGNQEQNQTLVSSQIENIDTCIVNINELLVVWIRLASDKLVTVNTPKKKWFSHKCIVLRAEVIGLKNKLSRTPNDRGLRQAFFASKKQYKKALKSAKLNFKKQISSSLEAGSRNPKMYWELLEQLRQVDEVSEEEVSPITADDWVTHYRELYKSYDILD